MKKIFLATLCLIITVAFAHSQTIKQTINSNWEFHKGNIDGYPTKSTGPVQWQPVSLPHSWNTLDVNDDEPGYYRGVSWYKKKLYIPSADKNKELSLHFEGANQEAEVYINGHLAGRHIGGYTAFNVPIQSYLNFTDSLTQNEVLVKLDNSENDRVPPLSADFTFFGGIYRDVYLVTAEKIHFDTGDFASPGIKIKTPAVSTNVTTVNIGGRILNQLTTNQKLIVVTDITDAQGKEVVMFKTKVGAAAMKSADFSQAMQISNPHLWSPDDPYLYRVYTRIIDPKTNVTFDEVSSSLGLRWYSFDADQGFFLNGKSLKLIGANRHQDFKDMGNALPNAMHERDMELLKNMGANFIRISHYPQDPAVLEACDRLGILASVEIPIVNAITESQDFYDNCKHMQLEMINQNYNHPAIVIWAYMNEVMLRPKYQKNYDQQNLYFSRITNLAKSLDSLTHHEDSERYTMISCHGDFDLYHRTGITAVPQIIGWNLYNGWYSAGLEGFAKFLDRHHQELPKVPMIVTEYGADADIDIHSTNPERFDKSIEYQVKYHQFYLKTILDKPFVAGGAIWALVDFNSESRADATPHINTKGLNTDKRQPKDAYFLYKANLVKKPFLKIGSTGWDLRTGTANDKGSCVQKVYVYSNAAEVELWQNGAKLKTEPITQGVAIFDVPFANGANTIKATATINGSTLEDLSTTSFRLQPAEFNDRPKDYTELNISLGDNRYFVDEKLNQVWMPEQPYKKGSWGYVGGKIYQMANHARQSFGSDKDIYGTYLDAVYQTQRVGLSAFKFDVPDGEYDLSLGFAELEGKATGPALVYNLGGGNETARINQRSFDVSINGNLLLKSLGTQNELQAQREYTTTTRITVKNNTGISVDFKLLKGETILNAIQLKKVY